MGKTYKKKNNKKTRRKIRGGVKRSREESPTNASAKKSRKKSPTYRNLAAYNEKNYTKPFYFFETPRPINPIKSTTLNAPHPDPEIQELLEKQQDEIKTQENSWLSRLPKWVPGSKKIKLEESKAAYKGLNVFTRIPKDIAKQTIPFLPPSARFLFLFGPYPEGEHDNPHNKINRICKLAREYVYKLFKSPWKPIPIQQIKTLLSYLDRIIYDPFNHSFDGTGDPTKQITDDVYEELARVIRHYLESDFHVHYIVNKKADSVQFPADDSYRTNLKVRKQELKPYFDNVYYLLRFYKYLRCEKNENGEPLDKRITIPMIREFRTQGDTINMEEADVTDEDYEFIFVQEMPLHRMLNRFLIKDYRIYQLMKTEGISTTFFWIAHYFMTNETSNDRYDFVYESENVMDMQVIEWITDDDGEYKSFLLDSSKPEDVVEFNERLLEVIRTNWPRIVGQIDAALYPHAAEVYQKAVVKFPHAFLNMNDLQQ
jgi:hypothetical protein